MSNPNPKNQFKPGQVTNPKGRPKKVNDIGRYIRKRLEKMPEGKDRRYIYYLVTSLLNKGIMKEDMIAVRELLDRAYGKPKQEVKIDINPKKELDKIKDLIDEKHNKDGKNTERLVSGHSSGPLQK